MSVLRIFVSGQIKPATHSEQPYCSGQALGQQIGAGTLSAIAELVPRAKSKNVVTTILRTVFFMFFLLSDKLMFWGKRLNYIGNAMNNSIVLGSAQASKSVLVRYPQTLALMQNSLKSAQPRQS
jgi:hypothetical protein